MWMNEELRSADCAHEAAELAQLDIAVERIHSLAHTPRPRALETEDERPRVTDEAAASSSDFGYEGVSSGHGPRNSSTYAWGSPPYAPRRGLSADARNSPHVRPSGGENATRSTRTAPGPNGIVTTSSPGSIPAAFRACAASTTVPLRLTFVLRASERVLFSMSRQSVIELLNSLVVILRRIYNAEEAERPTPLLVGRSLTESPAGGFETAGNGDGRYWARTSDPQLVEEAYRVSVSFR